MKVWKAVRRAGLTEEDARVALQMHDEIIMIVKDEFVAQVEKLGTEKFKEEIPGFLPFAVTQKTGQTWSDTSK